MKILMTTDTVGGVWHYAMDLISCLPARQAEVVLVAMGPEPDRGQQDQLDKLNVKFYHRPYKLEWMNNPWEDVEMANQWIKDICRQEKPDLLHFNSYPQAALKWDVPVILVAHSCVVSWWKAVKNEPLPKLYSRYFDTVKKAFLSADIVVSPTYAMLTTYQQIYGDFKNPTVIYNGFQTPDSTAPTDKQPIIFSMGRLWDEAKNIKLITQAAGEINGKIYIAGKQHHTDDTPYENIIFLGQLDRQEVFKWLKKSSIYLLPVKYEPFGLSFLEASAFRCALVGGDIPTLRELWKESMTYICANNASELAKACNTLLKNKTYCQSMGDEAYRNGLKYPLTRKKEQYIKLYNNALRSVPDFNYT